MSRAVVRCFAVNASTQKIEKIYANRKSCENYALKKDYSIDSYYIWECSDKFEKAVRLFEGDIFPKELMW